MRQLLGTRGGRGVTRGREGLIGDGGEDRAVVLGVLLLLLLLLLAASGGRHRGLGGEFRVQIFVKVGLAVGEVGLGRRALLGGMPQADVDLDVGLVYLVE